MPRILRSRSARALLAAGAAAVALTLTACASGDASADTADGGDAAGYGDITVQLSWLKNHEFSGYFEAIERGYFDEAGFGDVELVAGGIGGVAAATALTSGTAWVGIGAPADIAQANAEGADLRIIATTYQKNPFTLVSADTDPITEPSELVGKTIAIADSSATNWEAFLAANDIDPSEVNRVPYGDAQTDLTLGSIDGFMGYGDGGAPLRASGFGAQEFLLADHGLAYSGEAVVVTAQTLEEAPEKVEAFLTAYAQGWKAAFDDVDTTIDLVVDVYGKDQNYDRDEIALSWDQQAKLILNDESLAQGIGIITDDAVERNVDSLALVGYDVEADDLFDTTLIAKVYEEHPELILGTEPR
jgi:ABC-type nitrate/sulfonate/bicarbonate transport system substrate-binding protein